MQLKRLTAAFVFLAAAVLVFAQTGFKPSWATPKKASPAAALAGVWTMTSVGGEPVSPKDPPLKIEFRAGNSNVGDYLITRGTDEVEAGEFRLTDTPAGLQVDFGPAMGDNAGKIQHGILKVEDAKLTWCMSPAGSAERPATFTNLTPDAARARGLVSDGSTVIEAVKGEPQKEVAVKPAPTLLEAIQGKWKVRGIGNDPIPAKTMDWYNFEYTFKGNEWEWTVDGKPSAKGHLSIDETAPPARVDWVIDWNVDNTPGPCLAIMDLNGQTLRICKGPVGGKSRPAELRAMPPRAGVGGVSLETLVRAEPVTPVASILPSASPNNSTASLQGTWTVSNVGEETINPGATMTLTFEGDQFYWRAAHAGDAVRTAASGRFQVDATQTPMALDIRMEESDNPNAIGTTVRCLVNVIGNTLQLCMPEPGAPRPKTIRNEEGEHGAAVFVAHKN